MGATAIDASDAPVRRLIDAVEAARTDRAALEVRGGGTKAFYGEAPRGRLLETGSLAGISAYEPSELVVTVRAGTPLAQLEAALAECGQCLPFEPPRFASGGTVGGMVAAGLSGPARAACGSVRDHLLGATILDGCAQVQSFGGQVIKNVAGYDVARVFAGSWGVLGVLLEVSLKVLGIRPARTTCVLDCSEALARRRLADWAAKPWPLSASAWHEERLYLRFEGMRGSVAAAARECGGTVLDEPAAERWWSDLRDHRHPFFRPDEASGEALWRLSLPPHAPLPPIGGTRLLEWGGALVWRRGSADPAALRAMARGIGGHAMLVRAADKSCGAQQPLEGPLRDIHRRLKQAFDPLGLFNPGRLYPDL